MQILEYIVYAIGVLVAITWLRGIRSYIARGSRITRQTVNTTMLFIVSLVLVPTIPFSSFHLLWMFPASFFIGTLSLVFPFSLLSVPGQAIFHIACLGLDYDEVERNKERINSPPDDVDTAPNHQRIAEQEDADAQYSVGVMYEAGEGVPQDDAEAARWFQTAAEQGHADAQFNLGVMYRQGVGVTQDDAEAAGWYQKSAEQGHAYALYNLGVLYIAGEGVLQDYMKAHMFINLAASVSKDELRDRAQESRSSIASKMTPAQITEAQKQAREWKPVQPES